MQEEQLEKTATFFFPEDQVPYQGQRFSNSRRLVYKKESPVQLGLSIPSTTDTQLKNTSSKPSSAHSGLQEQYTPPQIVPRKRSELQTAQSDDRKPQTYRIFSSNVNQRSSYPLEPKQISFGQQFLFDNEFLETDVKRPSGIVSPSRQLNKLPDIFTCQKVKKNTSQGFRLHSGKDSKRGTLSNFIQIPPESDKKDIQKHIGQFQMSRLPTPKQVTKGTTKLPQLPMPFLQTKPQQKIINRLFSGKKEY